MKKLEREHEQVVKDYTKVKRKKTLRDNNSRTPSGFAAPMRISNELYQFLSPFGVKKDDLIARTTVTSYINKYIKSKDLQNPNFRREIIPDDTLLNLFGIENLKDSIDPSSPKVYSYLKLQSYLSKHFQKSST